jgi:hypothetical protein
VPGRVSSCSGCRVILRPCHAARGVENRSLRTMTVVGTGGSRACAWPDREALVGRWTEHLRNTQRASQVRGPLPPANSLSPPAVVSILPRRIYCHAPQAPAPRLDGRLPARRLAQRRLTSQHAALGAPDTECEQPPFTCTPSAHPYRAGCC